jgi:hypothetical protein
MGRTGEVKCGNNIGIMIFAAKPWVSRETRSYPTFGDPPIADKVHPMGNLTFNDQPKVIPETLRAPSTSGLTPQERMSPMSCSMTTPRPL